MPLYAALAALLLGVALDASAFGRTWTLSYIDLVGFGTAVAGSVVAWRRRSLRVDVTMLGYLALLLVIAMQVLVHAQDAAIVGGSSRFVTAFGLLFGLTQLAPSASQPWTQRWRWPLAFGVFGAVLAVWVVIPLTAALADPELRSFYDVKNAVVTPLGASNYLAAFLLFAGIVGLVHAVEGRRSFWLPGVALVGLLATMSRGAVGALVVVLIGLLVAWRERHAAVRAAAAVGVAVGVFALVAVVAGGLASEDVDLASPATTGAPGNSDDEPTLRQLDGALSIIVGGRQQLYRDSWEAFVDHPLLGVGINQLDTYTGRGGHPPHVNAHNTVLHALASTGVLGAAAYLAVLVVLLWRLWRLPPSTGRTALLAAVIGLLLHAQVEALTYTRAVDALLVTVLALAGAAPQAAGMRTFGTEQHATVPTRRGAGRRVRSDR